METNQQNSALLLDGCCSLLSLGFSSSGSAESSVHQSLFLLLEVGPTWKAGFDKVKRFLASKRV